MRFAIRDILIVTFVVALGVVVYQRTQLHLELTRKLATTEASSAKQQSEIMIAKSRLEYSDRRIAFIEHFEKANERAAEHFKNITERYSELPAKPKMLGLRSIPQIEDRSGLSIRHMRIQVPEGRPMILRSAVREHSNSENGHKLDGEPWREDLLFSDPYMRELRLEPGRHDIVFQMYHTEQFEVIEENPGPTIQSDEPPTCSVVDVTLDGSPLRKTIFLNPAGNSSGWSGPSGIVPYYVSLNDDQATLRLMEFNFRQPNELKYQLFFWVSGETDVDGFRPYEKPSAAIDTANFEETADE